MDFARKQLEKYGWKDGNGLGKVNQGINIALKPYLKTGQEGLGYDLSSDLTGTWWTKAYADSLTRINVNEDKDGVIGVGVDLDEDGDGEETESKSGSKSKRKRNKEERPMEKMRRRMMKANFTNFSNGGTLLTNGQVVDIPEPTNEEEEKDDKFIKVLTDEELFKACGGRTAHKAARFGLKLNGKLARIASQEESISKPCNVEYSSCSAKSDKSIVKSKRKSRS